MKDPIILETVCSECNKPTEIFTNKVTIERMRLVIEEMPCCNCQKIGTLSFTGRRLENPFDNVPSDGKVRRLR